ncbi:AraC family transcriptional regulator (plasmid) [Streptomyces sp. NBC_01340]|uniref:AraC family transcriptional regulator n=1 Tax=unclassified Streptomyces TaxID=2593676 RepID=UPI002257D18F|nr:MULTISPECIES: AraC family transcriptional regulator [unclassified Streptomyces]MCX4460810.1 AraC family transcriptional regulator [Streptomyces sp. NBC_01719]MCX4499860.1 AraC family transcriptional regulator [Streptomyces sp. NBC_01728]MCX4597759.1 AraC family transcriptional regulator [Streptomyces sp. NBC_01549]WSI44989.1 AraC family transcriptional regulator [Streptomyces sp. NBC_01340]
MKSGTTGAPVRFSTVGLPEAERIALWEEHNAETLIGLRCRSLQDAALDATEINLQLPQVHVARVVGSPHFVERPRAEIRRVPSDAVACYLNLAGDAFFYHDDGVRLLHPGQLLVCDADQPFMRGFSHGLEELAVKVPHTVWRDLGGPKSLPQPLVVDDGVVQTKALATLIAQALRRESPASVDEDVLLDLLGSAVTGRAPSLSTVHLTVAKAYIDEHLADSGLSAARVARGVGISERHLSRVFASGGSSVPQYLLLRRLERARSLLQEGGGKTVAEVAARCGFGSAAHFSHRFKERFGLRATDVLREARSRA